MMQCRCYHSVLSGFNFYCIFGRISGVPLFRRHWRKKKAEKKNSGSAWAAGPRGVGASKLAPIKVKRNLGFWWVW